MTIDGWSAERVFHNMPDNFRTPFGANVFNRYRMFPTESWYQRSRTISKSVTGKDGHHTPLLSKDEERRLAYLIYIKRFLPGGRYVYYAGRDARYYNNCYTMIPREDTREEWGTVMGWATSSLMTGGGIGVNLTPFREKDLPLKRTGGVSSGPLPLGRAIDATGAQVKQGGGRRSAIYLSLAANHPDADDFLEAKAYDQQQVMPGITMLDIKKANMDFHVPFEFTNISLQYSDWFLDENWEWNSTFLKNVYYAMKYGDPGFQFDFGVNANEVARNACTEVTSPHWKDVCNLGSVNMAACDTIEDFFEACYLGSKFLYCGSIRSQVQDKDTHIARKNIMRQGLGLMGVHEWLLRRGHRYEWNEDIQHWAEIYEIQSERGANEVADRYGLARPEKYRAIAPTGSISTLAGTTSGIEPIFAKAYKRRWIDGNTRKWQVVKDATAVYLIERGMDPDLIETSYDLAKDPERRIRFQYMMQKHVDMGISSTLNLPEWGTEYNNPDRIRDMAHIIADYAPGLRGLTFYPDAAHGLQPLTHIPWREAKDLNDKDVFTEVSEGCKSGVCGV